MTVGWKRPLAMVHLRVRGHRGALEADEGSCASTQRKRIESPEDDRVKRLLLGNGLVHDSHESSKNPA